MYAARRFDHEAVLSGAEGVIALLSDDPDDADLTAAVLLVVARSLVVDQRWTDALVWLEEGLTRYRPTWRTRELGDVDRDRVALARLYLTLGSLVEAARHAEALSQPGHSLEVRLEATRIQVMLCLEAADDLSTNQLLNSAAHMAERANSSRLRAAVDADRALVLAVQGRVTEAATLLSSNLEPLTQGGSTPEQAAANLDAVRAICAITRSACSRGRPEVARPLLIHAARASASGDAAHARALSDLASGVMHAAGGIHGRADWEMADSLIHLAAVRLAALGAAPDALVARLEAARLIEMRGWTDNATGAYRTVLADAVAMGMTRTAREARTALDRLRW